MAPIRPLPEEILALIIAEMDPKEDTTTITALRLASKTCCRLASPLLHRVVIVGLPTKGNQPDSIATQQGYKVLQRLTELPQLKQFVKSIVIQQKIRMSSAQPQCYPQENRADSLGRRSAAVSNVHLPTDLEQEIAQALAAEAAPGCVAFLLADCTDVESLELHLGYTAVSRLVQRVIEAATERYLKPRVNPAAPLQETWLLHRVKELIIGTGSSFANDTGLPDVLNLLCLPQLRSLSVFGLANNRQFHNHKLPEADNVIRNDNPISFVLDSCMLNGEGLERLLAAGSQPRSLVARWRVGLWNEHLTNSEIGDALRISGTTLDKVHLDTAQLHQFRRQLPEMPFGDLRPLTARTIMLSQTLPQKGTTGASDSLPESVEQLYVLGVEPEETVDFDDLLAYKVLPRLEKVVCVPWLHYAFEDNYGPVYTKCVDYDRVGGFELGNSHKE